MDDRQQDPLVPPGRLTRRTVISGFGALTGFTSLAALVAACGGDDDSSSDAVSGTGVTTGVDAPETPTPDASTAGTGAAVRGGDLIIDVQTEPQGFNPLAFPNAAYAWLTRQVIDSLYWHDETGEIVPVLAASAPESTDGMVWTVKLKEGVTWHNGDPFTAEHVAATFGQVNTPPTNAWGERFGDLKSVRGRGRPDREDHPRHAELPHSGCPRPGSDPAQGLPRGDDDGDGHRRVRVDGARPRIAPASSSPTPTTTWVHRWSTASRSSSCRTPARGSSTSSRAFRTS